MRTLLSRELSLAWGRGGGALLALAFYGGVAVLLPLSLEGDRLAAVAVGSAWVALALSTLLSLERLFERDYEDGALDLLALGGPALEAVCFIKCLAQWLAAGAPLALAAPIVAISLGADPAQAWLILLTALIGSLGFSFTGGIGASLSLGSRRGGILIAILVLPLFTPPVIFGAAALDAYAGGLPWRGAVAFLGAYSLAAVALGPIAMAAAVRNALS